MGNCWYCVFGSSLGYLYDAQLFVGINGADIFGGAHRERVGYSLGLRSGLGFCISLLSGRTLVCGRYNTFRLSIGDRTHISDLIGTPELRAVVC